MDKSSAVGVIDKAVAVLDALAAGPASLAELVERTGLARPTAHRLAVALEVHRVVGRDGAGRFTLGPRLSDWAALGSPDRLLLAAGGVLAALRDATGESAQLYRREGLGRRCVAAADQPSGLRDTVPVGALLPMTAGSGAQVLLAWEPPAEVADILRTAAFTGRDLAAVRRRGWAASVAEREAGVASVSAPVCEGPRVVAAVSVSGPVNRLGRSPGRRHADAVRAAAAELSAALGR